MRVQNFLIAGGNKTSLVWDCPTSNQLSVAGILLKDAEQVGFVSMNKVATLRMMGDELCVNATLALASLGEEEGIVHTSGVETNVNFLNTDVTRITVSLPYEIIDTAVLFKSIGYICLKAPHRASKEKLKDYHVNLTFLLLGSLSTKVLVCVRRSM